MIKFKLFDTVNQVPASTWRRFVNTEAVGLEINHLKAIEVSGINNLTPYYLIGYLGEKPVGIAYCIAIDLDLARISNRYSAEVLGTLKEWDSSFMCVRVLEIGHIASVGRTIACEHSVRKEFLYSLSEVIDGIARKENADLCLVRDVESAVINDFKVLEELGYHSFMGFPLAKMDVKWDSFTGYLAALRSKKRNAIRQKRSKLLTSELSVEIIEDYAPFADRLAELWTNVAKQNNGYEHERLTPAYFRALSECLGERSHVVAIKRFDEIIAYTLNLIGDEEYFGVVEGMDYTYRDQYKLYANNIFEGLRVASELNKRVFNIGVTTYDFKTALGAELDPSFYFIKACKNSAYSKAYVELIKDLMPQPDNFHRAFNQTHKVCERIQLKEYKNMVGVSSESFDPFGKHKAYCRADMARLSGLYPYYSVFQSAQQPVMKHEGQDIVMLGSNAYLGLATHPDVKIAAQLAIEKYGVGCSGSPLLNGTLDMHNELAFKLADFIQKDSALIYSTGYQANVGALQGLLNRHDVVIMDERNHASLVDGARLSGAHILRYKHNDTEALEVLLQRFADKSKLVVTDSVFSMEGTVIDLPEIVRLVKKYHARLMLDESHAIGVIGKSGRGVAEHYGLADSVDIIMGTFSKAFASIGGFVAGDKVVVDTLKHTSRPHIFSASLPPASVATVLASLQIIKTEPERRRKLQENALYLAKGLRRLGYRITHQETPIISMHCDNETLVLGACKKLLDEGVYVNPVTSPAVPKNQEMLRVSLMANHSKDDLDKALGAFERIRTNHWPVKEPETKNHFCLC